MIGQRRLVLEPREVPLGGVRGMNVLRALPHRNLPTIGAWCFLDRFGPADTKMRVEPHPHIGLQTVTWPLVGEIRHRDSLGSDADLRRGQLNLMTAANGISHSEYSIGESPIPSTRCSSGSCCRTPPATAREDSSATRSCRR